MAFPTTPTDGQEYRKWIYVASLGAWRKKPETPIGSIFTDQGEVQTPSADFPNFCLTNFTGSTTVPSTLPYLSMKLRQRKIEVNGVTQFPGTVSGNVLTLDSTTANQNMIADILEWRLDFGSYTDFLSGDIDGTTHEISNIDAGALEITFSTTPTSGTQNAVFYPHRVAGDATLARIHSYVGKSIVGAGSDEIFSIGHRRDRMQKITGSYEQTADRQTNDIFTGALDRELTLSGAFNDGENGQYSRILFDSANSPDARTSPATDTVGATHSPDVGAHLYMHAGLFVA